MRTISGKEITADSFAFDGCHKFYLIECEPERKKMLDLGYELYPIVELPGKWLESCPLRFIDSADFMESYVLQFEPAYFSGWDLDCTLQFDLDLMAQSQRDANRTGHPTSYRL